MVVFLNGGREVPEYKLTRTAPVASPGLCPAPSRGRAAKRTAPCGREFTDPGGLPARYILKAMIPLGFSLILLQGLALAARSLDRFIHGGEDPMGEKDESPPRGLTAREEDAV